MLGWQLNPVLCDLQSSDLQETSTRNFIPLTPALHVCAPIKGKRLEIKLIWQTVDYKTAVHVMWAISQCVRFCAFHVNFQVPELKPHNN